LNWWLELFHLLAQLLGTERGWLELAEGGGLIAEGLGWVRVQRAEELHYFGVDLGERWMSRQGRSANGS
jgi:hypothetical protein